MDVIIMSDMIDKLIRESCKPIIINRMATEYMVSFHGLILSKKRKKLSNGEYIPIERKILNPITDSDGYHIVSLHVQGRRYAGKVHRLVAEAFIPNPANKPQVNHKDGNKSNNVITNLEWVTSQENIIHAHENGLMNPRYGIDHEWTKYTVDQIVKVCKLLTNNTLTLDNISEQTGVNRIVICNIRRRKIWKSISKDFIFPPVERYSQELKDKILHLILNGDTPAVIRTKLNLPNTPKILYLIKDIRRRMPK